MPSPFHHLHLFDLSVADISPLFTGVPPTFGYLCLRYRFPVPPLRFHCPMPFYTRQHRVLVGCYSRRTLPYRLTRYAVALPAYVCLLTSFVADCTVLVLCVVPFPICSPPPSRSTCPVPHHPPAGLHAVHSHCIYYYPEPPFLRYVCSALRHLTLLL